ncbi:hypothetical protein V8F33_000021 [Rhypophila sp. PSN 637]
MAEHPEITASDAEDNAARVAETAFLNCIGKQLKPGFWLGHDFDDSENPEQALDAVSWALQEWASSMRSADVPDESDTLEGEAQLSWSGFEDCSGDTMSGVEDFAMGACDEINTFEDMDGTFEPLNDTPVLGRNDQTNGSDVVEHGENQGEARGRFEDEIPGKQDGEPFAETCWGKKKRLLWPWISRFERYLRTRRMDWNEWASGRPGPNLLKETRLMLTQSRERIFRIIVMLPISCFRHVLGAILYFVYKLKNIENCRTCDR